MRDFLFFIAILLPVVTLAQERPPSPVPEPRSLVVDSKDNVYVAIKYGIVRISSDGKLTNLTKGDDGRIGRWDMQWTNLIIDSKDNLYATIGKLIYKLTITPDNKLSAKIYAGQEYSYKIEDGPLATAGFNDIGRITIDRNDNIYLSDSYDKIKDAIGNNFVTDNFYLNDPTKQKGKPSRRYSVIRKISPNGMVSTLKTADGKFVLLQSLSGLTTDASGNLIYGSYSPGRFVAKIDIATGAISLIAGQPYKREYCPVYTQGGIGTAEFVEPETMIVNKKGEIIVADQRIHRIMKVADGKVSTVGGNGVIDPCGANIGGRAQEGFKDGPALTALFNFPKALAYDSKGNLYIADHFNHAIRKLSPARIVTTVAK